MPVKDPGTIAEEAPADLVGDLYQERARRLSLWQTLYAIGGSNKVAPAKLRELSIYGGAQGIWVDKAKTALPGIASGIAVAVLHTGRTYSDDLSEDALLYHFPRTRRPAGRDRSEIEALKAARTNGVPVFVITYSKESSNARDVRLGWVVDWDDVSGLALISFDEPPEPPELPFALVSRGEFRMGKAKTRPSQQKFKLDCLKRYGPCCAVCNVSAVGLLDAAHIRGKRANGSDDPRNGLILCANHHRAFDANLFAVEPESLRVTCASEADKEALQISRGCLTHLKCRPHNEALAWRWDQYRKWQ